MPSVAAQIEAMYVRTSSRQVRRESAKDSALQVGAAALGSSPAASEPTPYSRSVLPQHLEDSPVPLRLLRPLPAGMGGPPLPSLSLARPELPAAALPCCAAPPPHHQALQKSRETRLERSGTREEKAKAKAKQRQEKQWASDDEVRPPPPGPSLDLLPPRA